MKHCKENVWRKLGREVQEIGELIFVRELVGKNYGLPSVHQVEYYFSCTILDSGNFISQGVNPDEHQVGVEWLPIADIIKYRFYPQEMREVIHVMKMENRYQFIWVLLINDSSTLQVGEIVE